MTKTATEDRQVQSISGQLDDLKELANTKGIVVRPEHIFTESKSAKDPNNRPVFWNSWG